LEDEGMSALEIFFASFSLLMGDFLLFLGRSLARHDKKEDAMLKGMRLVLRAVKKTGQLAYANAVAYINHEVNGEMKEAVDGYREYMDELDKHLEDQAFKK
jgi:hypothetical protein